MPKNMKPNFPYARFMPDNFFSFLLFLIALTLLLPRPVQIIYTNNSPNTTAKQSNPVETDINNESPNAAIEESERAEEDTP